VRLSVVVCTRNRRELLGACLEAVAREQRASGDLEVVVVDNGSTDDTAELLASLPTVIVRSEPVAGLSHARNTGLSAATGSVVAFLDDDARPEPGWADALADALVRFPGATAFGGPVELAWLAARPAWLGAPLERWYSAIDLGPVPRLLAPHERPVGTNLAVVREAALAVGGFATRLGRNGTSLISEEDVELVTRLLAAGGTVGWVPGARVRHLVSADRMHRRWLLRRAWAQGRSDAITDRLERRADASAERRDAALALVGGWPRVAEAVRHSPVRQTELLDDLVRRTRAVGRAAQGMLTDRA
jgi:glycosyltransferase involved in cell wall biosynthesis